MALILGNGQYCKVVSVNVDSKQVLIDRYRSADQRLAWKAGTEDHEFDQPIHEGEYVAEHLDHALALPADGGISISENLVRAGYAALKEIARFQGAKDA